MQNRRQEEKSYRLPQAQLNTGKHSQDTGIVQVGMAKEKMRKQPMDTANGQCKAGFVQERKSKGKR